MRLWLRRAAIFAAFFLPAAGLAQDVTLTARGGGIVLDGTLQGFDGEFYRIDTSYGLLTVDAEGVLCTGPACPDLTAPLASLRITGAADPGMALLPGLLETFARLRGLRFEGAVKGAGFTAQISDPVTDKPLMDVTFLPASPKDAKAAVAAGTAELAVAARAVDGLGERAVALDALVPIVAADNPLPQISTTQLAAALAGEITNWSQIGGPDMPLVLHALAADTSQQDALEARLGKAVKAAQVHPDMASLAAAVTRDPYALAITGRAGVGSARMLPLTDSCGFPLPATRAAVKAEDYPLSLPIFLLTPRHRLPLMVREFLDFLALPPAQSTIAAAGYVDRAAERAALTSDGLRLMNAIRGAGDGVGLDDLKHLTGAMAGADRLSLTFRFEDGSSTLDANSRGNLADLASLIGAGAFRADAVVLAGFSDGSGDASANLKLSRERADTVLAALAEAVGEVPAGIALPKVEAFGEALPMACDTTSGGRRVNRRVEVWLRPVTDTPLP